MMKMRIAVAAVALLLAGCGTMFEGTRIDYRTAAKLPPLEVPPDLTSPTRDNRFQIPDVSPTGTATYSSYSIERAGAARAGSTDILPAMSAAKVRYERAGTQRWIVVSEPPEKVWPVVKEFWQELGFLIKTEVPDAGVMETDWAENRAKIPQDAIRNVLGRFFDGMYSTSERDKFRTRLEPGAEPGTTEIYVSHRGVAEVYTSERRETTVWQPRPADPELEAEFLRRLMVRFGLEEAKARAQLASEAQGSERAKIVRSGKGASLLEIAEPFDRAWRRVGLALDRVGFTVEDRDRAKGYYFVRYVDPSKDAQIRTKRDEGFFSKLMFWRSSEPEARAAQYRVHVTDNKENSQVEVLTRDGSADGSEAARRILSLLHEQLK